jgi:lipid-binding SYLF domain-containing protein
MTDTMSRRRLIAGLPIAAGATGLLAAGNAEAASARELTRQANNALAQLHRAQPQTQSLTARANAVMIFPRIVRVGLIIGGQSGDGVLRVRGEVTGFYNISAGSFGLQAGGQTFSYALFFMTEAALNYLMRNDGWAIGSGPSVVVMDRGAAAAINTTTLSQDVYAFPFGQRGLMAGLGLEGSRITRITPDP